MGMQNTEWAVRPPRMSKAEMPEEETQRMIHPCARTAAQTVLYTKVLPIPAEPFRK